jgi:hypothetical protein
MMSFLHLFATLGYVLTLEKEFPVACDRLTTDELGNIYLVCNDHLEKFDANGNALFRSSDLGYGDIFLADATNALKPFVYYRDQNVIVTFDNTLSSQGNTIDLKGSEFGQVELVGASRDNSFWLWNASGYELIRVSKDMNRINSSPNLGMVTGLEISPTQIIETATALFLVDPNHGLLEFDIFGTYRRMIPLSFTGRVQVLDNLIFYSNGENEKLYVADINLPVVDEIALMSTPESPVECRNGRVFYISGKKLQVYKAETLRD